MRGLEREISKICRKAVKNLLVNPKAKSITVNSDNLHDYLGVKRFEFGKADTQNRVGEVTGLAWTEVGGDLLTIETASVVGKGKLTFTGSLGDVMKESIQAAMTVVRARAENWVSILNSMKNVIFIFMCQMVPHQKMVQVQVSQCVPHWFLA